MIPRQTTRGLVLLSVLAALSWFLARDRREPPPSPLEDLDTRLNYALRDFSARLLDDAGVVHLQIDAPLLRNNARSGVGSIENPRLRFQQDNHEWYITSDSAIITADREHVSLGGVVSLVRQDRLTAVTMEIQTRDVMLNVTPRTASTDALVSINEAGDQLEAEGMTLDMVSNSYELLGKVRARYATR